MIAKRRTEMPSFHMLESYREQGYRERNQGLPPSNAPVPVAGAQELINETKARLSLDLTDWCKDQQRRKDEAAHLQQQIDQFAPRAKNDESLYESKFANQTASDDDWNRSPVKRARKDEEEARKEYDKLRAGEGGRDLNAHLSPWAYVAVMTTLAFLEYPINLEAVATIFKEAHILSYFLTAMVGILLVGYAHMTGRLTKQRTALGLPQPRDMIIYVVAMLLALGSLASIYYLRWRMMDTDFQRQGHVGELLFFLFLNGSVFFFGMITSIMHYDRNPLLQKAERKWRKAQKVKAREERKHKDSMQTLENEFQSHNNTQFLIIEQMKGDLSRLKTEIANAHTEWKLHVANVVSLLQNYLSAYAQGSLKCDPTAVLPTWLTHPGIEQLTQDIADTYNAEANKCA
jgi:hypothetical protein